MGNGLQLHVSSKIQVGISRSVLVSKMKLFFALILSLMFISANAGQCHVRISSAQYCKKICQMVLDCGAFTWDQPTKICFSKDLRRWRPVVKKLNFSGYKFESSPIFENTDYEGGDLTNC